jgi:hypothetical protein
LNAEEFFFFYLPSVKNWQPKKAPEGAFFKPQGRA